jgi:predicted ATPase/DNA-binding SARP family transcriptional activator
MPGVASLVSPLGPPPLASLTSFIGREGEVAAIADQLTSARLVTLTGAGGSGKTRLASEVLRYVAGRFRDGAAWIELAAITEPELVLGHLAGSLGIGGAGRPPADALRDALRDSERLIALDNCEQVVDACAAAAELILRHCPGIRILATSREALGIAGERAWLVPLLSLPRPDDTLDAIASAESVRLFVERARAVSGGFGLTEANAGAVAQLCRRLDGLPLAIELAAARARALTPEQMLSRLETGLRLLDGDRRGAAARHRTLRATIDWSWELLEPDEQVLLRRLSVFADELSLPAAEAVCAGDGIRAEDVLDLLAALVDKSLVVVHERADEARYHLLETIRQYAREHLDALPEAGTVRARHARFFADLVREAEPHFITPARPIWVDRIQRELDDIRLVLVWTRADDRAAYVELVGRLGWFWYSSGLWTEGRRWLEEALALREAHDATERRAAALFAAGVIAALQGEGPTARGWLEEAGAIARTVGDRALAAYADSYIGVALGQEGLAAAEAPTRAALEWFVQSGDLYGQRLALVVLATLFARQGDLAKASAVATDGVRVARAYGLGRELGIALQVLGTVQLHQHQLDAAAATIADALRALRSDPQPFWLARALELMGLMECARGHSLHGARLFGAAERRRERMGAVLFRLDRERLAPAIAAARESAGADRFDDAWAAGRTDQFERVVDTAIESARWGTTTATRVDRTASAESEIASPRPVFQVQLLGRVSVIRDGAPLSGESWTYARPREMFAFLLVHPDGCTREQLSQALWPEASVAQAKNNVHVTLHHLRRSLGRADVVLFDRERYVINWSLGVEVDVNSFEREVEEARRALRANPRAPGAAERLRAALDAYRGDFLADESAGDWHLELRDRLQRLRVGGLSALGAHYVAAGAHVEAVEVYRQLVQVDEWDEAAHRDLMITLARSGQRGDALRQYDRLAARLASELDAEPAPETTALYDRLRRGDIGD